MISWLLSWYQKSSPITNTKHDSVVAAPSNRNHKVQSNQHEWVDMARVSKNNMGTSLGHFSIWSEDQWGVARCSNARVSFHCQILLTFFPNITHPLKHLLQQNITCLLTRLSQQNVLLQDGLQKSITRYNWVSKETSNFYLRVEQAHEKEVCCWRSRKSEEPFDDITHGDTVWSLLVLGLVLV